MCYSPSSLANQPNFLEQSWLYTEAHISGPCKLFTLSEGGWILKAQTFLQQVHSSTVPATILAAWEPL